MHVAVGFMPAFKYLKNNSLIVFERGHKAHGYESAVDRCKNSSGLPAADGSLFESYFEPGDIRGNFGSVIHNPDFVNSG